MRPPFLNLTVAFGMLLVVLTGCSSPQTPPARTDGVRADEQIQPVDELLVRPEILKRVEPDRSKHPGIHARGTCLVEALVAADGHVVIARVVQSLQPEVDSAAVEAVRQWTFRPAWRGGKPVQAYYTVSINVDWL